MPSLKQVAKLAHDHLRASLEPYGCEPFPATVVLWRHKTRPTKFFLCVDDFGIKHWSQEDADHLRNPIGATLKHTVDKEGKIIAV